jgi:hypothetical protein
MSRELRINDTDCFGGKGEVKTTALLELIGKLPPIITPSFRIRATSYLNDHTCLTP